MIYYTIYLKHLANGTGYVDVCLQDEQLFKDYMSFLDVGMKTIRSYAVADVSVTRGSNARFVINLDAITAMLTTRPASEHGK